MQQLSGLPSLWWSLLLAPIAILWRWKGRYYAPAGFFVAGIIWVTLHAGLLLQDPLARELEGKNLWVEGIIADLPKPGEYGPRFEFQVLNGSLDGQAVTLPSKIQLSIYRRDSVADPTPAPPDSFTKNSPLQTLQVGDQWGFLVRLKRPYGFQNPGGFDYEGHLFHKGIRATGYVRDDVPPRLIASRLSSRPIDRVRQHLSAGIDKALSDNPYAGFIKAFATGDETGISDVQWTVLQRTGTTHLVAISGMNIGLVAGIVFFLMRWLWALPGFPVLRWPAHKVAAVAAMFAAVGYSALAGFAIPTQRAMLMLAVVLGAILLGRQSRPSHLLALALLLVLIHDPLAVMSAGLWLSFAAVAVILLATHGRIGETRLSQWNRLQWVIAIGLLPLMLATFQQTSLSGPLANMLAIPVIEIIVIPLTLLGVVALPSLPEPVSQLLFQAAAWPLDGLWPVLEYFAGLEHTLWVQHAPPAWTLAVAGIGALLLLAPRGWPARWLGILWLLPMLLLRPPGPAQGDIWLTLLDVGQGLAAVVRTERHVLVFDTGPRFSTRFDTGSAVLTPYLRNNGVDRLDTLIVSHGDNDHIGGASSLLDAFPALRVLSSVPESLPGAQLCRAGQTWSWDGINFTILNPQEQSLSENNDSCVLKITGPGGTILLTGDIEAEAEQRLIEGWGNRLQADILVVPHHGSKTSSTDAFLATVNPELALLPVGYRNRYRHPHPTVMQRYRDHGIQVLDSPTEGAITIKLHVGGAEVSSYRREKRRYWFSE